VLVFLSPLLSQVQIPAKYRWSKTRWSIGSSANYRREWLQNFRRLVTRYERHIENFMAFVQLACIVILSRQFVR
jgi:transposase